MENKLFLITLIIFASFDFYKLIKKDLGFYSFFRPLSLAISYKFILDGIDQRLYVIVLVYFIFLGTVFTKNMRKEELYEKEI